MKFTITYQLKNGTKRAKAFIRDTSKEAIAFFNWRYGHKIIDIKEG